MPKHDNTNVVEEKWYYYWQWKGFFTPILYIDKLPYCIVFPTPNMTGI